MAEPRVAIIISTYNQKKLLERSLESIKKKTDYQNYKVYVIDDSGNGEIGKYAKNKFKWVDVTINKENKGFSGANNVGIKRAIKEYNPGYFLLLNDDIEIIDKSWLKKMIEVGEKDKRIGILGCKILYPEGDLQNIGGYIKKWKIELEFDNNKKETFEVDHVMGAFMIIRKEAIKDVGLLDEIYNPYLLEDTDYCLRAKRKGWKIISVPYVSIIHKKGKSIDSLEDKKRMLVRFKNDIIFSKRYLRGYNKFFRIFIYLPLVAIFRKKKDMDELRLSKFSLRKRFLRNLGLWFIAFFPKMYKKRLK
ncbi:MAG: glycosyltransferase family 2 protein [Candidatus Pacearchaeota archaeon]|nr:glycosyltransferase family 2 protein [Candidatus Pacearchaeota archaeon]